MRRYARIRGLAAAGLNVMAFTLSVGVARAQPLPTPPPVPPIIDQLVPLNPAFGVDPNDEGGISSAQGTFGRFCENWWVHCQ